MLRRVVSLFNPFTRTALLAFAWSHRRTIMRWGRSLYAELRRPGRIEPRRLQTIGRVLWTITRDDRLADARQLRDVRLRGDDLVVDVAPRWSGTSRLVDAVSDIPGVAQVVDQHGTPLAGSILVSSR